MEWIWRILYILGVKFDQLICPHIGYSAYGIFTKERPNIQIGIGCRNCGKRLPIEKYGCDDSPESIIVKDKNEPIRKNK